MLKAARGSATLRYLIRHRRRLGLLLLMHKQSREGGASVGSCRCYEGTFLLGGGLHEGLSQGGIRAGWVSL